MVTSDLGFGPYGTHVPALAATVLLAPPGDLLELGGGEYSTTLLRAMAKIRRCGVTTVEDNPQYRTRLCEQFGSMAPNRITGDVSDIVGRPWALVFIDSPAPTRAEYARLFIDAPLVVIHDTEDPIYHLDSALALYKYRLDYKRLVPWTTILSNTSDLSRFGNL